MLYFTCDFPNYDTAEIDDYQLRGSRSWYWRNQGRCPDCGGRFKGISNKRCSQCGKPAPSR